MNPSLHRCSVVALLIGSFFFQRCRFDASTNGIPELSLAFLTAAAGATANISPSFRYALDGSGVDSLGGPSLNLPGGWAPANDRNGVAGGAIQLNDESITYSGPAFARDQTQFFSVAIWFRPTGFSANERGGILSASSACTIGSPAWGLEFRRDGMANSRLRIYSSTGGAGVHDASTPYSYPLGVWYHVVGVHAPGASAGETCMRLYLNGLPVAENCLVPAAWLFGTRFDIGCGIEPPARYLRGDYDEYAFFDRALSSAEALQYFQSQ